MTTEPVAGSTTEPQPKSIWPLVAISGIVSAIIATLVTALMLWPSDNITSRFDIMNSDETVALVGRSCVLSESRDLALSVTIENPRDDEDIWLFYREYGDAMYRLGTKPLIDDEYLRDIVPGVPGRYHEIVPLPPDSIRYSGAELEVIFVRADRTESERIANLSDAGEGFAVLDGPPEGVKALPIRLVTDVIPPDAVPNSTLTCLGE